MRQPAAQMGEEGGWIERGARQQREHRQDLVLAVLARHRDGGGLADRGMRQELLLDLEGGDVLAPTPDRVLGEGPALASSKTA